MNCPYPPRPPPSLSPSSLTPPDLKPGWIAGGTCDPDSFAGTCGHFACCTPEDTCENLSAHACYSLPPIQDRRAWSMGVYCGERAQACAWHACVQDNGTCAIARPELGCEDPDCCEAVCDGDPWCCRVEWDTLCLRRLLEPDICSPERKPLPNDSCATDTMEATWVGANDSVTLTPLGAWSEDSDPEFCCYDGLFCYEGFNHEFPCVGDEDCPFGVCRLVHSGQGCRNRLVQVHSDD